MWVTKAHILKIDTPLSKQYAAVAAESCDNVGLPWEYFNGFHKQTGKMAFGQIGIKNLPTEPYRLMENTQTGQKAMCCTAGHFAIWKKIAEGPDEAAVVLEHDAIMLHPITLNIPENRIVVLGYKLENPKRYDWIKAGPPKTIVDIRGHEGAHAYAMTKSTAIKLIKEIEQKGIRSAVDNDYFILGQRRTEIPLSIMSPTPAMGWLRESTIWGKSAARNYDFIPSFRKYYK